MNWSSENSGDWASRAQDAARAANRQRVRIFFMAGGLIVVRVTRIFVQVRSGMIGISGCQERGIFEKRERFYVRLLVKH
jgi:hypothetical protein